MSVCICLFSYCCFFFNFSMNVYTNLMPVLYVFYVFLVFLSMRLYVDLSVALFLILFLGSIHSNVYVVFCGCFI